MGDAPLKRQFYSVAEYEALVRDAREGERYEYVNGQIIRCEDYTTDRHNQIVLNCFQLLANHFYPKGCRVYTENVRLVIGEDEEYRLPDVMVTCSERDKADPLTKRDPVVLIEVLSPSTAMQDFGSKLDAYRKIDSLQAYLIIHPNEVWVRVYHRDASGQWPPDQVYALLDDSIGLDRLGLTLPLREVYRFVF
jgi:Uma2 family endonuclease